MSTRKKVWQYHCDFCTKRNLSAGSIAKHEKHCTMNPNRVCRMCKVAGQDYQKPIPALTACLSLEKPDYGIEELRDLADGCPACILSAIRQSKIKEKYKATFASEKEWSDAGGPLDLKWDFKEALKEFWSAVNEDSASPDYY